MEQQQLPQTQESTTVHQLQLDSAHKVFLVVIEHIWRHVMPGNVIINIFLSSLSLYSTIHVTSRHITPICVPVSKRWKAKQKGKSLESAV